MSRELVTRSFRFANGQMAARQAVTIVYRGTDTPAPVYGSFSGPQTPSSTISADSLGSVAFYAETGFYDFLALGARIPFDVEDAGAGGGGGGSPFIYTVPANAPQGTWSIAHPFGRLPIVELFDTDGNLQTIGFVATESSVVVQWPYPVSGKAVMR